MCFIKAILEHFRARRKLCFGSPDIVWPVHSRSMVSVDQHGVVTFVRAMCHGHGDVDKSKKIINLPSP